ncbi:MAG: hypothetical protein FWD46_02845 [Cystobacterineae bacterium]|nr:hypothetical protein [Cystobacterineae bacterium]
MVVFLSKGARGGVEENPMVSKGFSIVFSGFKKKGNDKGRSIQARDDEGGKIFKGRVSF